MQALFFGSSNDKNDSDQDKTEYLEVLDIIVDSLSTLPNMDTFEIIGCYSLNKQLTKDCIRLTRDIDLSISVRDTWEYLVDNIVAILNRRQSKYIFSILSRRGYEKNPNSDSIKFMVENRESGRVMKDIKIDMNIKTIYAENQMQIGELNFSDIYTMFVNKLYVASTTKIYRRVKDFYDIYSILKSESERPSIDMDRLVTRFKATYNINFNNILLECYKSDYKEKLKHAYERNDLFNDLESFDDIYDDTLYFIQKFYMDYIIQ